MREVYKGTNLQGLRFTIHHLLSNAIENALAALAQDPRDGGTAIAAPPIKS